MYWDPFLDALEYIPVYMKHALQLLRCIPLFTFLAAATWFAYGFVLNMMHEESVCVIEALPEDFETEGNVNQQVVGIYEVSRKYPATADRLGGVDYTSCEIRVRCEEMSWGDRDEYSDDRCAVFQSYGWGERIACYFNIGDPDGSKGSRLYCVNQPTDLQKELFTLALAAVFFLFGASAFAYIQHRRITDKREEAAATEKAANDEAEINEAKRSVAEKDMDTLKEHLQQRNERRANRQAKKEEGEDLSSDSSSSHDAAFA